MALRARLVHREAPRQLAIAPADAMKWSQRFENFGRLPVRAWLVAIILALHAGLLGYSAARHSPTIHELAHLPAGICHWQYGMFELYRVNPPLPRMVAALPMLLCDPKTDWGNYQLDPLSRETIPMGIRFAKANGERTLFLFMIARWACIPFSLLGAWTCYRWAGELWGGSAGLFSLCLWCFDPMMLGHGAVVMPDVPAAAMGTFAAWRFWKWLREPSWRAAGLAGLALGLAELCKTTLLVFYVLWPVAWLAYRRHHAPRDGTITRSVMPTISRKWLGDTCQLLAIVLVSVYLINLGYAFKGSFQRLGDYRFQSRILSGQPPADPPKAGNRFKESWLARLPVPLPRDYVQGIDRQRADFEQGGRSYLHGRWSPRGWWYYYLVGLAIKLPLGTLTAIFLAAIVSVWGGVRATKRMMGALTLGRRNENMRQPCPVDPRQAGKPDLHWRDGLFPLATGAVILALVSSQTGFSAHFRYAIPALPFLFIWCGKLAAIDTNPKHQRGAAGVLSRWRFGLVWLCLAGAAVESLSVYPHSISFFNVLVGGPSHGHEWLLDSNCAWGQDLVYLREWAEGHPEARPLRLATVSWLDPQALGIDYTIPPVGPSHPLTGDDLAAMSDETARKPPGAALDNQSHHAPRDASEPPGRAPDDYQVPQTWQDVRSLAELGPKPGWYAIDVNFLHGTDWPAARRPWHYQKIAEDDLNYEYFRLFQPSDRVAYSYLLYHITPEQAAAARRELGLP